jgi:hypothetical protein
MAEQRLFDYPIQTIKAVSMVTGISRTTLLKASKNGLMGDCVYQSGDTWLIDTSCQQFQRWLTMYPTQRRVKGQLARQRK